MIIIMKIIMAIIIIKENVIIHDNDNYDCHDSGTTNNAYDDNNYNRVKQ